MNDVTVSVLSMSLDRVTPAMTAASKSTVAAGSSCGAKLSATPTAPLVKRSGSSSELRVRRTKLVRRLLPSAHLACVTQLPCRVKHAGLGVTPKVPVIDDKDLITV